MNKLSKNSCGFTLVELMLTMAVSGIIVAAIYSAYMSQQRTYLAQEQVAEMQQNIRAAIDMMTREIRMAGYDPNATADAKIIEALPDRLSFTMDFNGNGTLMDGSSFEANEKVAYRLNANNTLGRTTGNGVIAQPVAENISQLEFHYLDAANVATTTPANVRSVQISILARASKPDRDFANTMTYTPASGATNNWGPYNDNFRRRLLITSIQCRNLGLE